MIRSTKISQGYIPWGEELKAVRFENFGLNRFLNSMIGAAASSCVSWVKKTSFAEYDPQSLDKSVKFPSQIKLNAQKLIVFEREFFRKGVTPHPTSHYLTPPCHT